MDPQKTVVTSEALLGALQMPLPWGTTAGLRLPTYNPLQQDPNATSQKALAAPTPIHPNNPIYNGISQDILANILRIQGCTEITEESIANVSKPSSQISNLTAEQNRIAALKLEEKIKNESQQPSFNVKSEPQQFNNHPLTPEPSPPSASTFTRAPGHGPDDEPPTPESLVCPECGFACQSKFHFNSHMNTHGDHKCKICNYTSRTEGRVNKHMRDSHSIEEQIAECRERFHAVALAPSDVDASGGRDEVRFALVVLLERTDARRDRGEGVPDPLHSPSGPRFAPKAQRTHKRYSCKHCDHVSTNKNERYEHSKLHIPVEKQLCCPKCSFVTEYKHHLEYHLRNHYNSKPFFCDKCNYACVNKSMLNSHLKSHSTDYHFKCMDCTYATKYCHSLKLHLKKYDHRRLQTEEDKSSSDNGGSPGALDVMTPEETNYAALLSNAQIDAVQSLNILHPCTICGFQSDAPNEQIKHNFQHLVNGQMSLPMPPVSSVSAPIQIPISSASLLESLFSGTSLSSPSIPVMVSQAEPITVEVKVEVDQPKNASIEEPMEVEADAQNEDDIRQECLNKLSQIQELQQQWRWKCETCRICFQDETLYLLHLKCHGDGNPFQCANCPFVAENALDFNEHLMQGHPVNSP
ncbi:hypothetical protein L596_015976 [Steinernema carpocapsae]|uniref:C2H2-type domain-containing protein n=1 Tax=Steinernema carpocapsae TaxID=34508 RepID=A0A4U5NHU0_STECR|nr:hypothetical protein L596_015976 [Steinernema carpocapsae]